MGTGVDMIGGDTIRNEMTPWFGRSLGKAAESQGVGVELGPSVAGIAQRQLEDSTETSSIHELARSHERIPHALVRS